MKIVIKLLFALVICFISACDDSQSDCSAPILEESHLGWRDTDCMACHTSGNADGATMPHDDYPIPDCAECHGANGACARPQVGAWHPAESCAAYNCHGANHGFTDDSECWKCHVASAGVFQCTVYQ